MPEEINGYHLFQYCLGREPGEAISFEELENDLGSSHGTTVGYGINTGNRRWRLNFPTLPGASGDASITYRGMTLTPAKYVWELFCNSKRTGEPFVIQSSHNDQYYLAKFADRELDYTRFLTKLYASQLQLKQHRVEGVTVFDVTKAGLSHWFDPEDIVLDGSDFLQWPDAIGDADIDANFNPLEVPAYVASAQNSLPGLTFDGGDDYITSSSGYTDKVVKQAFFVVKFTAAAFANIGGLLTADETDALIVTAATGTKFFDFAFSNYEYEKDAVAYLAANQQAPMQQFGVVYVRLQGGVTLNVLQLGWDRDFVGRFTAMTLCEWGTASTLIPDQDVRELVEHLITRWNT